MEYEKVPEIITGKDLDYLTDMFNWNYCAYKNTLDATDMIEDETLVKHINKASKAFYTAMNEVLEILKGDINENSK